MESMKTSQRIPSTKETRFFSTLIFKALVSLAAKY